MNLKLKSSKSSKSSKSLKFKSTKRYRRRKVRENNKHKYGIDKNSNHRVTQKVWRLPGGPREKQQKQQYQEKDKNMHSMTSRRQQGHDHDDITKVKTLQDATLKASRLYGMMRDFIHPAKINYQKIHSKWRNMKKQVQVGGEDKIMSVTPKAGTEAVPVVDKDCVELPPKLSLHVTAHPDDPKKFIVKRLPGDPLIDGSLTKFAEGLMGHLDKVKMGTEFDTGDADILALIARDLILLILSILRGGDDDDDDDDEDEDEDGGEERMAAALDAESRNAAAAAIIIALIGLIKNKDGAGAGDAGSEHDDDDDDDDDDIKSLDGRDATIQQLHDRIRELEEMIDIGVPILIGMGVDAIRRLQEAIRLKDIEIQALRDRLRQSDAANLQNVRNFQALHRENQDLIDQLAHLRTTLENYARELDQADDDNEDLRNARQELRQQLHMSEENNGALQRQLDERNRELEAQRAIFVRQEQGFRQQAAMQRGIIADREREIDALRKQNATTQQERAEKDARIAVAEAALRAARDELDTLDLVGQSKNVQLDQLDARVRQLKGEIDRLGGLGQGHAAEIAQKEAELDAARVAQAANKARIQALEQENQGAVQQAEAGRAQVEDLTEQLNQLQRNLADGIASQVDVDRKQRELDEATRELHAAREQTAALGAASAEKDAQIGTLEATHANTEAQLGRARHEAQELQAQLGKLSGDRIVERDSLLANLDAQKKRVDELDRKSKQENERLYRYEQEVAEITKLKEKSDSENARILAEAKKTHAKEIETTRENIAQRDATIADLRQELERLRREQASLPPPPPPPVDDVKLRELKASLRDELDGAARSATDNLDQVFGTGHNAQDLIRERKRCVERNKNEIFSLIEALTLEDARQTTDENPAPSVKTIKHRIQLIREMCKSKLRTFIVQRGGGDSFTKTGAMITKKPEEVPRLKTFKSNATSKFQEQRQREHDEQVEKSIRDARKWGPFSDVYDTSDNQIKFQGIKTLIDDVPSGKVVVIFGYGYSGSGKTYTLFGNDDIPGIAQLAIEKYAQDHTLRVHFKNIRELYNCTYQAADGAKAGVSEFYYKDMTQTDDATFLSRAFISDHSTSLTRETFNDTLKKVETARRIKGHIFPTHNNPQSSRGHLFVELKVQKDQDPPGYLIFCDMGGREDPNEMWSNPSYKYCSSSKLPIMGEPIIPGPIVRGDPEGHYYNFPDSSSRAVMIKDMDPLQFNLSSNERAQCKPASFRVTTYQAVNNSASDKHTGLDSILQFSSGRYKSAAFIMKTLREAFYINDSINHLLDHFEYYETPEGRTKKKPSNWDTPDEVRRRAQEERKAALVGRSDGISATRRYYPDIFASISQTVDGRGDPIGMKDILSEYSSSLAKSPDNIRYCTFACIRTEKEFEEDSINTLKFASQVNSCKNADCDAAACRRREESGASASGGLGGGAKTRRNRSQGKVRTQRRRRRRIVKPKSHPVTAVTTQRRNMHDKKKGHRTRKMK